MGMRELGPKRLISEKLEVFLHRSIRKILSVTMKQVKEEISTNETIRRRFFDIPTIQNQVTKRQITFIVKVTRNSDKTFLTKLLPVWCNNKRQVGGVLHSNKKTLFHDIALIFQQYIDIAH